MKWLNISLVCMFVGAVRTLAADAIDHRLQFLYAFQKTDSAEAVLDPSRVQIILGFATHKGRKDNRELFFVKNRYYSIYISDEKNLTVKKEIQVFFGAGNQFAALVLPEKHKFVGIIGEMTTQNDIGIYVGVRAASERADLGGYKAWLESPCTLKKGLYCDDGAAVSNSYSGKNMATIAINLPLSQILTTADPAVEADSKFYVWAKSFVRQ